MNLQVAACFVALQEISGHAEMVAGGSGGALPYECPTLEFVKWAYCCVKSRAFTFEAPAPELIVADGTETNGTVADGRPPPPDHFLLPFADLLNHSFEPTLQHVLNADRGSMTFVASRRIEAGEELTHSYSAKDKSTACWFLLNYGNGKCGPHRAQTLHARTPAQPPGLGRSAITERIAASSRRLFAGHRRAGAGNLLPHRTA